MNTEDYQSPSSESASDRLYQELPEEIFVRSGSEPSYIANFGKSFFESHLSEQNVDGFSTIMCSNIALSKDRSLFMSRTRNGTRKKAHGLSASMKRKLGLDKIAKRSLKFSDFMPIHQCWTEYMEGCLRAELWQGVGDTGSESLAHKVWKADLHGALLTVTRSKCPALVGIKGFVVMETKNMFKLLGPDDTTRCVPKAPCELSLTVHDKKISMLGKSMMVRPSERAIKKLKVSLVRDLLSN